MNTNLKLYLSLILLTFMNTNISYGIIIGDVENFASDVVQTSGDLAGQTIETAGGVADQTIETTEGVITGREYNPRYQSDHDSILKKHYGNNKINTGYSHSNFK